MFTENLSQPKQFSERNATYSNMREMSTTVVDLDEKNVDDALDVCTSPSVRNEADYLRGCEIRKKWLSDVCRTVGPCAKVAYVANKPVGAIEYTPLHSIPYLRTKRKDALYIHCIYVQKRYRHRGIGSALLDSLTNELTNRTRSSAKLPAARLSHQQTKFTDTRKWDSSGIRASEESRAT